MKTITCNFLIKTFILGVLSAATFSASAQSLFTTQNDFSPWNGGGVVGPTAADTDGSTINGLGNTTAAGGTGTAGSLSILNTGTGFIQQSSPEEKNNASFLAALKANNTLTLTYTLTSDITTGSGGYWQLIPVFNWSGGYQQLPNNSYFSVANGTLSAGTHTVTFDYSSLQAGLPTTTPGYFQLQVVVNSGGTGLAGYNNAWSLDNITVGPVPEPSTLALIGLGAFGGWFMLRRRVA